MILSLVKQKRKDFRILKEIALFGKNITKVTAEEDLIQALDSHIKLVDVFYLNYTTLIAAIRTNELKTLIPGDWVNIGYGFYRHDFYVLHNKPEEHIITLGLPTWCVSSSSVFPYNMLITIPYNYYKSGHTKKRWWWKFIPGNDCICPYILYKNKT